MFSNYGLKNKNVLYQGAVIKISNMFKIIGRYNSGKYEGSFEVIDSADHRETALIMLHEYEMAFGNKYELDVLEE
jgi:hypothetical protein